GGCGEPAAPPGQRAAGDHPLSAPARLHRAGPRARAGGRPHPGERRQGAGAGAGEERLRRLHRGRGSVSPVATAMPDSIPFTEHYGNLRETLPGQDLPWLARLRQGALARFTATGLPTPRQESWKYTNLRPLEKVGFGATGVPRACVSIDCAPSLLPAASEHHRLVFVDGHHRVDLSSVQRLPEGAELTTLRELLAREPDWVERHLGTL